MRRRADAAPAAAGSDAACLLSEPRSSACRAGHGAATSDHPGLCKVLFTSAQFSGGTVYFSSAQFSGSTVSFLEAQFSGGMVNFNVVTDWSFRPTFPWTDKPPSWVKLPKEDQSQTQQSSALGGSAASIS